MEFKVIMILIMIGLGLFVYYDKQTAWDLADKGLGMINPNKTVVATQIVENETNTTVITFSQIEEPENTTQVQNETNTTVSTNIVGKPYGFNCVSDYDCSVSFSACHDSACRCNKETGECEYL